MRWAKVFSIMQMAKMLLFLQEHGTNNRKELNARADAASEELSAARERIAALDARITEVNALRGLIIACAKSREVFAGCRTSSHLRNFENVQRFLSDEKFTTDRRNRGERQAPARACHRKTARLQGGAVLSFRVWDEVPTSKTEFGDIPRAPRLRLWEPSRPACKTSNMHKLTFEH